MLHPSMKDISSFTDYMIFQGPDEFKVFNHFCDCISIDSIPNMICSSRMLMLIVFAFVFNDLQSDFIYLVVVSTFVWLNLSNWSFNSNSCIQICSRQRVWTIQSHSPVQSDLNNYQPAYMLVMLLLFTWLCHRSHYPFCMEVLWSSLNCSVMIHHSIPTQNLSAMRNRVYQNVFIVGENCYTN